MSLERSEVLTYSVQLQVTLRSGAAVTPGGLWEFSRCGQDGLGRYMGGWPVESPYGPFQLWAERARVLHGRIASWRFAG